MTAGTEHYDRLLSEFFELVGVPRPTEVEGFTVMEVESIPVRLRLQAETDAIQRVAVYITLCELSPNDALLWHRHLLASNMTLGIHRVGAITMLPDSDDVLFVTSIVLDDQLDGQTLGDFLGELFRQVVSERQNLQRTFEQVSARSGVRSAA